MKIKNIDSVMTMIDERFSLWIKLLNEPANEVSNSLHNEFKGLLLVMGVIESKDINSKGLRS